MFHRGAVAELVPRGRSDALDDQLAALVRKELIRPELGALPGRGRVPLPAPAHPRSCVRRDAEGAAGAAPRAATRRWLEQPGGRPIFELDEIIGYHLEQALILRTSSGCGGRGAGAGRAAGGSSLPGGGALGRADYPGAAALLQRGVDCSPTTTGRCSRRGSISPGRSCAGVSSTEPRELLQSAIEHALALGDRSLGPSTPRATTAFATSRSRRTRRGRARGSAGDRRVDRGLRVTCRTSSPRP